MRILEVAGCLLMAGLLPVALAYLGFVASGHSRMTPEQRQAFSRSRLARAIADGSLFIGVVIAIYYLNQIEHPARNSVLDAVLAGFGVVIGREISVLLFKSARPSD